MSIWAYKVASLVILLAASVLRLIKIHDIPPGLARDETLNADISNLIIRGQRALFFREGFGHEPLYHYIGAGFQKLLGDNVLSIRLPSVFLSLILISLTIYWLKREFGRLVALSTGGLLAVSWWAIIFGRVGLRPILEPVLLVLAAIFWRKKPWLAGISLGLATYSYTSATIMLALPLFMITSAQKPESIKATFA